MLGPPLRGNAKAGDIMRTCAEQIDDNAHHWLECHLGPGNAFGTIASAFPDGGDAMTHISAKASVITLINVFTVEPVNQRRLLELLTEATEVSVGQAPGFVSASLHRSLDGTKVTMYAQWRSIDEYQAMRLAPVPLPYLQEALTISKFEPGIYEVVRTFAPAGEPN
jgi:quinol monooxygenase YgiN